MNPGIHNAHKLRIEFRINASKLIEKIENVDHIDYVTEMIAEYLSADFPNCKVIAIRNRRSKDIIEAYIDSSIKLKDFNTTADYVTKYIKKFNDEIDEILLKYQIRLDFF
jgi:transposase